MALTSNDPKIARIKAMPFFSAASERGLEMLAQAADEVTLSPNHDLVRQGHISGEAFAVESGVAEVLVDDEVVAEISAGSLIGELAFLDPGPATATVRSKTSMELLVIPHNRLDAVVEENPALLRMMANDLAHRLRKMDERHQEDTRTIFSMSVEAVREVQPPMLYTRPPM